MYRDRRRACPGCARPMEQVPLGSPGGAGSDHLDRCPRCESVFADYFDGDPSGIARRMFRHRSSAPRAVELPRDPVCPDCEWAMVLLPYLDTGASIWRCEGCAGAFLTPAMLDRLASYRWAAPEPPGLLSRLLEWWRVVPRDGG